MSKGDHKEPNYMGVFWALLILTLAEVGIFYLNVPRLVLIVSLVAMALAKAALVAAYFMHLSLEKRTLALIVITPLVLSCILLIGLVPDSNYSFQRSEPTHWVLPGHGAEGEEHESESAPSHEAEEAAEPTPADPDSEGSGEAEASPEEEAPAEDPAGDH